MTFKNLIGQKHVIQLLSESIQTGRIGHAYLFCGPEGIGRSTVARCFAEALTCEKCEDLPCGECEGCVLNRNGTNPDIVVIQQQEGKATVGVEDVRSVQDEISTAPRFGRYKVLIFKNAEKMTVQAQNALLKTLEEPPPYIVMILLSSNNASLLDTVKSRSVRIDFKRYTNSEIIAAFENIRGANAVDPSILCEYSDGIIGRALSMADTEQYEALCDKILNCICGIAGGGGRELCRFENLLGEYAEQKELFFFTLYSLFRDVALAARYVKDVKFQNVQAARQIREAAEKIGYHKAMECIEHIGRSWRLVGQNVNYKLTADALAIRIQEVIHG